MDTLDAMKVFVRVADTGGFAQAARQLDLAAGSVTRAVQALEGRLGVRLFHRTTRSVRLTDSGERYLQTARRALADLEVVEDLLRRERSAEVAGTLRLTMPVVLGVQHIVPLLAEFVHQHPRLRLDLHFDDAPVDIVAAGFDAAVRVATELPDSLLTARRIASSPIVACGAPRYLARHGLPQDRAALARHRTLQYAHQPADGVAAPTVRANNAAALKGFAIAGHGLVQAPAYLVADDIARGALVQVLADTPLGDYAIHVVFAGRAFVPLRLRVLIDFLAARLGNLGLQPPAPAPAAAQPQRMALAA